MKWKFQIEVNERILDKSISCDQFSNEEKKWVQQIKNSKFLNIHCNLQYN